MQASQRNFCAGFFLIFLAGCGGGSGGSHSGESPMPGSSTAAASSASSTVASSATSSLAASLSSLPSSSSSASSITTGMAARPSNTTCLAPPPVTTGAALVTWPAAFPQLPNLSRPSGLFQLPGDNTNWYLMNQVGTIQRFSNQSSAISFTQVLDIQARTDASGNEDGLLGFAPHPQFASNHYLFLYYTGKNSQGGLESRVARFTQKGDGSFDAASEQVLLRIDRPYSNHVGGQMAFGSDGYLYIASGDGGSGGDPHENGQNKNVLLGKILRIDVDHQDQGLNYAIPADNPFVGQANTRGEIWAYGLRNPWRFSFDKTTNKLWVGDVGQSAWEEINLVTKGGNYGWGDMEGDSCYSARPNCSTTGKIKPLYAISQATGACSVIGGFVYRGSAYPSVAGKYFFTDYCAHAIQSLTLDSSNQPSVAAQGSIPASAVSFAQDNQGELYVLAQSSTAGKQIFKMQVSGGTQQPGTMPDRLSTTGCTKPNAAKEPAEGLIPYDVISQLWSDGASKSRYMALPDGQTLNLNSDGDFNVPVGSVLVKHFKLDGKFVETRLFAHGELGWQGFSYEWLDDQSDALLLPDAKDKMVGSVNWHFPSRTECLVCHTEAANFALGLETLQLNSLFLYPNTQISANQLATLEHIGLFNEPVDETLKANQLASLVDVEAGLGKRARSYLHSNCSNCHRPGGTTTSTMDLRFSTAFADTKLCNQTPVAGDLGISNAMLIAPGGPDRSVLLARMKVRDENQMPPLATHLVDQTAVQLVSDWISSLTACD